MSTEGTFWRSVYPPIENPTMRILSHGGGVQTWTIALMAARGEIDPIDAAIMGDPGAERRSTWEYWEYGSAHVNFPLHVVSKGDIYEHIRRSKLPPDGKRIVTLPYFLADGGRMMRTCTGSLKIEAVTRGCRELLGLRPRQRVREGVKVEVLIGISTDERQRAGGFPAERWQHIRYPLLEEGMSYNDCVTWLRDRQYRVPPRSRCVICAFRSNDSWRELDPDEFELACQWDDFLRKGGIPRGYDSAPFLHSDRVPLREVDLSIPSSMFDEDCMGGCNT